MADKRTERPKAKKGFAVMDAARQQEIASLGGKAAHQKGVAHRWDRAGAIAAGKKGGHLSGIKRRSNNDNKESRE